MRLRDESDLLARIMTELCHPVTGIQGLALWRNSVGFDEKHKVRYGLQKGSADLIGCYRGHFISLELKRPARTVDGKRIRAGESSPDQQIWRALVLSVGGRAGVVRTVEEARKVILG